MSSDAPDPPAATDLDAALGHAVRSGRLLEAYSDALAALAERTLPAVASVRVRRPGPLPAPGHPARRLVASAGSAVSIAPGGRLLTAAHVVERARSVVVVTSSGVEAEAGVSGVDPATDLALLEAPELPGLGVLSPVSGALRVGEWVMAVGGGSGLRGTVTTGVLAARGRSVRAGSGRVLEDMLQSDALLSPGGSGGALVDARGRLVGISVSVSSSARGASFAVPSATALWVADRLRACGAVRRPRAGLVAGLGLLAPRVRAGLDVDGAAAVRVESVEADGPAAAAGLLPGDLLVALGGLRLDGPGAFRRCLAELGPGEPAALSVVRGRELMRIELLTEGCESARERDA